MSRLWQRSMIALARSDRVTRFMQSRAAASRLASRFVGGATLPEARETAQALKRQGLNASFFYLGEYVTDAITIQHNVNGILESIDPLAGSEVDLHLSVDPSQIGFAADHALGQGNAKRIADALAQRPHNGRKTLMLDMEDYDYVGLTLDLRRSLEERGAPTAVTVQAYLHRSEADIRALCGAGAFVRLVKGAFVGEPRYAFSRRHEIDANYLKLTGLLLSAAARKAGAYPAFATHDHKLIGEIRRMARDAGWAPGAYEFEMLYGVRPALQEELVGAGESVRLYLPYGRDWWPYAIRRVGENPRNAAMVARALLAGR